MIRRLFSRIAFRLLLFNILLVFLPVGGFFSLRVLERQLLDVQERSMVQQGRLVAAALGSDAETIVPAEATGLLRRLGGHSETRIRIVDRSGRAVADSASLPRASQAARRERPSQGVRSRRSLLYRFGAALWKPIKAMEETLRRASASFDASDRDLPTNTIPRAAVRQALAGGYGATVRESVGQRSLTMYSVVPVRNAPGTKVVGAVVVSQSTSRILRAVWVVRRDLFKVVVISVILAAVLSLLVSATIARPLTRLRDEADELLDRKGRLRKTFRGSKRRDEIGDLARALETLTRRLERHLVFVESFSADVAHEFKNPLASIRSSAELLSSVKDPATVKQLATLIEKEAVRLNRLLNGVREVSKIDAALDTEQLEKVDLALLLSQLARERESRVVLVAPTHRLLVAASPDRLIQALGNIVENAVSFSPDPVSISLREDHARAVVLVEDGGPGIPPEHLARIFDRFFSYRPDGDPAGRDHDGLGLAIAKAIIEGYGGSISASNLEPRGTRFEVTLPLTAA